MLMAITSSQLPFITVQGTVNSICPALRLGSPPCALCVSGWFPSAIFLCCTVFLPAVKMQTADGQEINLCLWGFYVFVCFDVYCSTAVSPKGQRQSFCESTAFKVCVTGDKSTKHGAVVRSQQQQQLWNERFLLKCKWNVNQIFPSLHTNCC